MALIDSEALLELGKVIPMSKAISDWDELDRNTKIAVLKYAQYVKRLISNAPAVDAVEVVRCTECQYMKIKAGLCYCKVWQGYNGMGDEGFCNYGERRNDGT